MRPDPAQRARLVEIRDNLIARIAEAKREGWLGEIDGLRVSMAGAQDKLAQIDATIQQSARTTNLGMPTFTSRGPSNSADPEARLSGPGEKVRP